MWNGSGSTDVTLVGVLLLHSWEYCCLHWWEYCCYIRSSTAVYIGGSTAVTLVGVLLLHS